MICRGWIDRGTVEQSLGAAAHIQNARVEGDPEFWPEQGIAGSSFRPPRSEGWVMKWKYDDHFVTSRMVLDDIKR